MGGSQKPFIFSQDSSNPFLGKFVEIQENKKSCQKIKSRTRLFLMKRRASLDRRQRRAAAAGNGIGRKVRTLKKLIPNGESKEIGALFLEAADYILGLQMRVEAMQLMVNALSANSNDDDQ